MTRQEAIKILDKYDLSFCDIDGNPIPPQDLAEACDMAIEALEQEPKRGKWILESREIDGNYRYRCSECGHIDIQAKTQEVPYCWYCGARMESEE